MPLRAVPNHAVGGVDCLVDRRARQPGDQHPEGGRHHPVGEILGEAFDRRPRNARLVKLRGVAAHNMRYCGAGSFEPVLFQGCRDSLYMGVQASLSEQRAGQDGHKDDAEREEQKATLDEQCNGTDRDHDDEKS